MYMPELIYHQKYFVNKLFIIDVEDLIEMITCFCSLSVLQLPLNWKS